MSSTQFTIRIDAQLKKEAQDKANERFGIGLGTLTKLFFKAFVGDSRVNFYLGDKEFEKKLDELLQSEKAANMLKKLGNAV